MKSAYNEISPDDFDIARIYCSSLIIPVNLLLLLCFPHYVAYLSEVNVKWGASVISTRQSLEWTKLVFCRNGAFNIRLALALLLLMAAAGEAIGDNQYPKLKCFTPAI